MDICALCQIPENQPLKKNTHFLTDGIIRTALNMDGSKGREEGFYFEFSNNRPFIEPNFQHNTSVSKLEKELGREVTDIEIEKSKSTIVFSVDDVFCKDCEDKFTKIETNFQSNILPKLRTKDLNNKNELNFSNSNLIRVFFILQIWRTNICDPIFKLSDEVSEELRNIIWEYSIGNHEISKKHPLIINYLETLGEKIEYTKNMVGYSSDKNPFPIWMNDFIIQFYESKETLKYIDFYDLNSKEHFYKEANLNEIDFKINIKSNQFRNNFNGKLHRENVITKTNQYTANFKHYWNKIFKVYPSQKIIDEYLIPFICSEANIYYKYSEENLRSYMIEFIEYYVKKDSSYLNIYNKVLLKNIPNL